MHKKNSNGGREEQRCEAYEKPKRVDINPTISIITLNVNGFSNYSKRLLNWKTKQDPTVSNNCTLKVTMC